MLLPFNLAKSFMSCLASCLSSSFYNNILNAFLISKDVQNSSIKSMQEVEASTLEIWITHGIDCSIFTKET